MTKAERLATALALYKQSPALAIDQYPEYLANFNAIGNKAQEEIEAYRVTGEAYYDPADDELVEEGINSPEDEEI